jgi:hypothetical protein
MLTAVQWVCDPKRRSGKDSFGVEYEWTAKTGTILTSLRISPGKRYRMHNLDWIVAGERYLRRVTLREMRERLCLSQGERRQDGHHLEARRRSSLGQGAAGDARRERPGGAREPGGTGRHKLGLSWT